jgi:activating signal cointegrator complex subunit 3
VVIKGTEFFDPNLKRYVDFPLTDLLQMIGRAGRPGFDDSGTACVFVTQEKKNFYKKFLYEPFPVESSLANCLTDHLNAEIASGTLHSRQNCIDYLTWTYFFRRLAKNPAYYNLDGNNANSINDYLNSLVNENLAKLRDSGCVELATDSDSISPTQLGHLASFYYVSHETVAHLQNTIHGSSSIAQLIDVLSRCQEFKGLPVRHNEEILNESLSHVVPLPVNRHTLDSPHTKTNLLLQAHFERCPLPITDFITDSKSVLD